jgi:hypothetical protein
MLFVCSPYCWNFWRKWSWYWIFDLVPFFFYFLLILFYWQPCSSFLAAVLLLAWKPFLLLICSWCFTWCSWWLLYFTRVFIVMFWECSWCAWDCGDGICEVRLSKVALYLYIPTAVRTTHGMHAVTVLLAVVKLVSLTSRASYGCWWLSFGWSLLLVLPTILLIYGFLIITCWLK